MTTEKKLLGISPSGGPTDVADVFSTQLYTGNATARSITNGIDLAGEGGMVWTKQRSSTGRPSIVDTERGNTKYLKTDVTGSQDTSTDSITAFNSNGYNLGADTGSGAKFNTNNVTHVSWTFRKKKKFFDVVTPWTGNDVSGRTIAHGLDGPVGMIIAKRTNASQDWVVWHKDLASTKYLTLNTTAAEATSTAIWTSTAPTSTVFSVGDGAWVNSGGSSYVAYVFADNSSEDVEDQMIKCGSYTGNGYATHIDINLGWEPQFVLLKNATASGGDLNWQILDTMRGYGVRQSNEYAGTTRLRANTSDAEQNPGSYYGGISSTGFSAYEDNVSYSGDTYIYMAIRAPMMVEPKAATDVFAVDTWGSTGDGKKPALRSGFPVDLAIRRSTAGGNVSLQSRLTGGNYFRVNTSNAQAYDQVVFDYNNGYYGGTDTNAAFHAYMWKRAKGYMDAVAYSGSGSNRTIPHSLGVVPEMIWVKSRSNVKSFGVYHPSSHAAGNTIFLDNDHAGAGVGSFQSTAVSATTFNVDTAEYTNESGWTYIAYLFATLAGISKVGSFVGNGSSQTISCGFSAGSRFILIKRIGVTGDWYIWNSVRGIVAGNDPHLSLNTTAAQVTTDDSVDPHNSGFIVNQVSATNINVSSATYIFYAIA